MLALVVRAIAIDGGAGGSAAHRMQFQKNIYVCDVVACRPSLYIIYKAA